MERGSVYSLYNTIEKKRRSEAVHNENIGGRENNIDVNEESIKVATNALIFGEYDHHAIVLSPTTKPFPMITATSKHFAANRKGTTSGKQPLQKNLFGADEVESTECCFVCAECFVGTYEWWKIIVKLFSIPIYRSLLAGKIPYFLFKHRLVYFIFCLQLCRHYILPSREFNIGEHHIYCSHCMLHCQW